MVAPCSPVSTEELQLHSSSSYAHCTRLMCKDESDDSDESHPLAPGANSRCFLCEHSEEISPVNVKEYALTSHPLVPNGENCVDTHNCPASSSLVESPVQNRDEPVGVCVQHCADIGSTDPSSMATHTPSVSNLHVGIPDSCREAMVIPMEGPATGVMSICGMRPEMEDAVTIAHRFLLLSCRQVGACLVHANDQGAKTPLHFFGVYDGHGGSQVSNFCKYRLHSTLADEFRSVNNDDHNHDSPRTRISWEKCWEKAMFSTFQKMDALVEGFIWRAAPENNGSGRERISEPLAPETVGSTAVIAVVGSCQIIVANCGDSRAVLSRGGQAIALSVDHKPNREDEMERIEAAGGKVICWNGYRVFGVLAMSRAIGDRYLKPYVISEPEVKCISRMEDDDCLILASDGLWDVLTNEEVCEVARRCLTRRVVANDGCSLTGFTKGSNDKNAEAAAALLTKMALAQGSHDNISVVVVDLKDRKRN